MQTLIGKTTMVDHALAVVIFCSRRHIDAFPEALIHIALSCSKAAGGQFSDIFQENI